jgi:hypothetical protein
VIGLCTPFICIYLSSSPLYICSSTCRLRLKHVSGEHRHSVLNLTDVPYRQWNKRHFPGPKHLMHRKLYCHGGFRQRKVFLKKIKLKLRYLTIRLSQIIVCIGLKIFERQNSCAASEWSHCCEIWDPTDVFLEMLRRGLRNSYRCFGRMCCLRLQSRIVGRPG